MVLDDSGLTGNSVSIYIKEQTNGVAASHIIGSPFTVDVSPGPTSSAESIAYGKGLQAGEVGQEASFTVQMKDAQGNNRLETQGRDVLSVEVFQPNVAFDAVHYSGAVGASYVAGSVAYLSDGRYRCAYTTTLSGDYTVAVMRASTTEEQVITATWNKWAGRVGTYTLSHRAWTPHLSRASHSDATPVAVDHPDNAYVDATALAWDATSEDIQTVLEALSSISKVSVSARQEICPSGCAFHGFCSGATATSCGHNSHCPRTETCEPHDPDKFGFVYTVTFVEAVGDVEPIRVDFTDLGGDSPDVTVSEKIQGVRQHLSSKRQPIRHEE